jgi:hypothetical protein
VNHATQQSDPRESSPRRTIRYSSIYRVSITTSLASFLISWVKVPCPCPYTMKLLPRRRHSFASLTSTGSFTDTTSTTVLKFPPVQIARCFCWYRKEDDIIKASSSDEKTPLLDHRKLSRNKLKKADLLSNSSTREERTKRCSLVYSSYTKGCYFKTSTL